MGHHFGHHMGHQKGQMEHHTGCGCQMCAGHLDCKKKMFLAMIFFGMMAMVNMFIVCIIHLKLHAKEVFK